MKALIAYYSRSGNTRKAVEALAERVKADIEEIIDTKNRQGFWNWFLAGRDAFLKNSTVIRQPAANPAAYDVVIVATPIWAGSLTPAIRTFILQNRSNIGTYAVLFTKGGFSTHWALKDLQDIFGKAPRAVLDLRQQEINSPSLNTKIDQFAGELG